MRLCKKFIRDLTNKNHHKTKKSEPCQISANTVYHIKHVLNKCFSTCISNSANYQVMESYTQSNLSEFITGMIYGKEMWWINIHSCIPQVPTSNFPAGIRCPHMLSGATSYHMVISHRCDSRMKICQQQPLLSQL